MRFDVRRNPNRIRTILILAGAFTVFSVFAFVLGGAGAGTTLLMISGVILVLFAIDQGKVGWYYDIGEDELTVRRTFKRYSLSGSSIVSVARVGWPGVWKVVNRYRSGDIPGSTGNRQVALGRLIGFSAISIPVRGRQPTGREAFVILKRTEGREYVLTPANPDGFVRECQRLIGRGHN